MQCTILRSACYLQDIYHFAIDYYIHYVLNKLNVFYRAAFYIAFFIKQIFQRLWTINVIINLNI